MLSVTILVERPSRSRDIPALPLARACERDQHGIVINGIQFERPRMRHTMHRGAFATEFYNFGRPEPVPFQGPNGAAIQSGTLLHPIRSRCAPLSHSLAAHFVFFDEGGPIATAAPAEFPRSKSFPL